MVKEESSLENLLKAYGEGSSEAFHEFFRRTRTIVYGYLKKRLSDTQAADDVLQDTYFRVHRYVTSFDPEKSALAWVLRIAHGCFIDQVKKSYRAHEVSAKEETDVAVAPRAEEAIYLQEVLRQAESVLSPDEISLIVERFIEDDSYEDIASRRALTNTR